MKNENERKAFTTALKKEEQELKRPQTVLEKLRERTSHYADQLAVERNSYIVRINTLATEAHDAQREYILELEKKVKELEAQLKEKDAVHRSDDGPGFPYFSV